MAGTTNYFGISYPTATDYVKDGASAMQTIATGFDTAVAIPTYNNQTGTTYTFVLADAAKVVSSNNASAVTFTIPPQSSVTWTTGTTLTVANYGAGSITIAGGAGVTVTNASATISQYGSASIIRTASDAWTVIPFAGGAALLSDSAISGTTGSPTTATYTSGGINYKTYTWTGSGSITFNRAGLIDILVVGGGGSGGTYPGGDGGGGAGQYLRLDGVYVNSGVSNVYVGAGASASSRGLSRNGNPGFPSSIASNGTYLFTAIGGGFGCGDTGTGGEGGSGGGGSSNPTNGGSALLTGGNNGGNGASGAGGGGGGASQVGANATTNVGGAGGNGTATTIRDGSTSVTYAGGGGGAGNPTNGAGGAGGGGTGSGAGTANTGGGGGAISGAGGSGIVIIRVRA